MLTMFSYARIYQAIMLYKNMSFIDKQIKKEIKV